MASLVRFKTDRQYQTTTPTYVIPLKVDPEKSTISSERLYVGEMVYITREVIVTSPIDVLMLEE